MNIISKFSLYDLVAMVIPGFTILLFITSFLEQASINAQMNINPTALWIIAITLSYILGVINELISKQVWGGLRNNVNMINAQLKKIKDEIGTSYNLPAYNTKLESPSTLQFFCYTFMYCTAILGILFGFVRAINFSIEMNHPDTIALTTLALLFLLYYIPLKINHLICNNQIKEITNTYYNSYYFVMKGQHVSGISIIESQVAFLQNMLIPVALFIVLPTGNYIKTFGNLGDFCVVRSLLAALAITMICVIYIRIEKIYYLVWSDYEYLKRIEDNK